jgi:formylglycine-generating enzyme required for sulfatase activity
MGYADENGSRGALRGGSFNNTTNNLRGAERNRNNPNNENNNIGFRCARPNAVSRGFMDARAVLESR